MRTSDFFNTQFKAFSQQDNVRSIPSLVDGLKDSQRKAIHGMRKNGNREIKVSQLAEIASKETHYEHGGVSLEGTIVKLAQRFPGANNLNMFEPIGQFGSILGSEAGASRYIFTKPAPAMSKVFKADDDLILEWKTVDGEGVEPRHFYPTIPLWAINGSDGIGTGYRSLILARDPKQVAKAIKDIVRGKTPKEVPPSFTGWTGDVSRETERKWVLSGKIERVNTTKVIITEILPGIGVDKVKERLVKLIDNGDIKDYNNFSSEDQINIEVIGPRKTFLQDDDTLMRLFGLVKPVTEQVNLWSPDGKIVQYSGYMEALEVFVSYKLGTVGSRIAAMIESLHVDMLWHEAMVAFIDMWNRTDNITKLTKEQLVDKILSSGIDESYVDRLVGMRLMSITDENKQKLLDKIESIRQEIEALTNTSPDDMYCADLSEI